MEFLIIDNSIETNIFACKTLKFSAIFILIICIILISVDISDSMISKTDSNLLNHKPEEFQIFKELAKTIQSNITQSNRNLIAISNETFVLKSDEFLEKLNRISYRGKWNIKQKKLLLDKQQGTIKVFIEKIPDTLESFELTVIFFEGDYADKWKVITCAFNTSEIDLNGYSINLVNISSKLGEGEFLERFSTSDINVTFRLFNWTNSNDIINNFSGEIIYEDYEIEYFVSFDNHNEMNSKIAAYAVFSTILALSQLMETLWISKICDSPSKYKCVSLHTVLMNIIWNAFGCYLNFMFAIEFQNHRLYFAIPSFVYFINFSIFELRFLFYIWKNQNQRYQYDQNVFHKKLVNFFAYFYILIFVSLFLISNQIFDKKCIIVSVLLTWFFQIVHNFRHNNTLNFPLIHLIMNSINKISFPIYFRGEFNNFLNFSPDRSVTITIISIIIVEISILFLQGLYGPRFLINFFSQEQKYDYYKDQDELVKYLQTNDNTDCLICLLNIFDTPSSLIVINNDFDFHKLITELRNENKCITYYYQYFTKFYLIEKKIKKKKFMVTPCRHVFHTQCLETWFFQKKECPTCRNIELP